MFRWVSRVLVPTAPFGVGVGVSLGGVSDSAHPTSKGSKEHKPRIWGGGGMPITLKKGPSRDGPAQILDAGKGRQGRGRQDGTDF